MTSLPKAVSAELGQITPPHSLSGGGHQGMYGWCGSPSEFLFWGRFRWWVTGVISERSQHASPETQAPRMRGRECTVAPACPGRRRRGCAFPRQGQAESSRECEGRVPVRRERDHRWAREGAC